MSGEPKAIQCKICGLPPETEDEILTEAISSVETDSPIISCTHCESVLFPVIEYDDNYAELPVGLNDAHLVLWLGGRGDHELSLVLDGRTVMQLLQAFLAMPEKEHEMDSSFSVKLPARLHLQRWLYEDEK